MMLSALIIFKHRANIQRLFKGEESKIWKKGKANE
jgi:glycerol-3-phosphate acyltransferase PlsY